MTEQEIDAMDAGREMDRLLAERVMEQTYTNECPLGDERCAGKYEPQVGQWPCLPPYSTDIAAAWPIAANLELTLTPAGVGGWFAFCKSMGGHREERDVEVQYLGAPIDGWVLGKTAPLAICKFALKAALRNLV